MSLKVLQIIPVLGTGGAEQACVDMALALVARGDQAIVVSYGGRRVPEIQKAGVVPIDRNVASKNPLRIIANGLWLARLIWAEHIDIVHARSRAPAWSAWIACALTGCAYVTTFHAAYKYSCAIKRFYNSVMAKSTRMIAISPSVARYIKDSYGVDEEKVALIDRGIDCTFFDKDKVEAPRVDYLRHAWRLDSHDEVVLLPGRLSPIKNHDLIIDAMISLRQRVKKMPVVCFVGDDQGRASYTEHLQDRISKEGLGQHIRLVGACSDMPAALALASLVVMPSKVPEGFGRVPVEAMAMGVPVIASNLGGTQDTIVEGKTGWLLPPDDAQAWALAMEQALNLSSKDRAAMAKESRQHVLAHFTDKMMVAKTLALYDEVAGA